MEAHETGALNSSHGENSHDDLIYSYLKGTREEDKLTYQAANYLFSLCQKHLVEHSREKKSNREVACSDVTLPVALSVSLFSKMVGYSLMFSLQTQPSSAR